MCPIYLRRSEAISFWGIALFLLIVFIFSTPFDLSRSREDYLKDRTLNIYETVKNMENVDVKRRVALFTFLVFAILILLRRRNSRFSINGFLGWLILFYLFWAALSLIWGDNSKLTFRRVVILFILSIGAYAFSRRLSVWDILKLTLFICGVTLLISLFAEIFFGTFNPLRSSWRFAGVIHPVAQGWNCGLLAISAFYLSIFHKKHRTLFFCVAMIALIFLTLTRSRMAFASSLIGISVLWIYTLSKTRKVILVFIFWFFVYIALIFFILGGGEVLTIGIINVARFGRASQGKIQIVTLTDRVPLWVGCMQFVKERPMLGYGYNAFLTTSHSIRLANIVGWNPGSPHNGFLEILLGLGLIGLVVFLLVLFFAFKIAISLAKEDFRYIYFLAVFVWLCINLITEALLITRPIFPNFLCMVLFAKLAFQLSNSCNNSSPTGFYL